jgi:hypothetical protein
MTIRSMAGHMPANCLLPSGRQVANVWTADPGVQVENVSARGRRARYQRVPGSLPCPACLGVGTNPQTPARTGSPA